MKKLSLTVLTAVLLGAAAMAAAQNPPAMPKPGPEIEKLKYFLGDWKEEGTMQPGPMGPGGKFTGTYHNVMMSGGFFVEMHSTGDMAGMGKFISMAFAGYNTEDKVYTYDEFSSTGEHVSARGTLEGDTWTWTNEEKMMGKVMKGRVTEKMVSPTEYTFKFEMSMDGGDFATVLEGKATKGAAKAAATGAATDKSPAKKPTGAATEKTPK
jgi:uncharacterized protein DUF1579